MPTRQQLDLLVKAALRMRNSAKCGLSGFSVGAALLTADGRMFTGCNIECIGQTASICAERTALFKALSEDASDFAALAIAGGRAHHRPTAFCTPCGVCRQVLLQYCPPAMPVIIARSDLETRVYTVEKLLPEGFTRDLSSAES